MVAAHELGITQRLRLLRMKRRALGGLCVRDDVGAQMIPFEGGRAELASQSLADTDGVPDRRVQRVGSGYRGSHQRAGRPARTTAKPHSSPPRSSPGRCRPRPGLTTASPAEGEGPRTSNRPPGEIPDRPRARRAVGVPPDHRWRPRRPPPRRARRCRARPPNPRPERREPRAAPCLRGGSIRLEKPAAFSRPVVVVSGRGRSSPTGCLRTSMTRRATQALSAGVPIGAAMVCGICSGRRSGSLTRWNRRAHVRSRPARNRAVRVRPGRGGFALGDRP